MTEVLFLRKINGPLYFRFIRQNHTKWKMKKQTRRQKHTNPIYEKHGYNQFVSREKYIIKQRLSEMGNNTEMTPEASSCFRTTTQIHSKTKVSQGVT